MKKTSNSKGHIFACTKKSEKECLERSLFSTNKIYEDKALGVKKNDILFLYNLETDILFGPFKASTNGKKDIEPDAWNGQYPYQVRVKHNGKVLQSKNSKKLLDKLDIDWKKSLYGKQTDFLLDVLENPKNFDWDLVKKYQKTKISLVEDEKPKISSTTLWDYPRQNYGKTKKGDNKYAGVTPAFVIYNMIKRYTEPGDLVVDPMAGSGTTFDVCKEEKRKCKAFDIVPTRPEIIQNDARKIPLGKETVDMVFIDSPYGDNIDYNDHPKNIGKISGEDEKFYDELEIVMKECKRILKPGKAIGWLISDQWVKKKFTPVGFKIYQRLEKHFTPLDVICVTRRNQTSNTGMWYNRAIRFNFYLRGFKYLLIFKKADDKIDKRKDEKIKWTQYSRKRKSKK